MNICSNPCCDWLCRLFAFYTVYRRAINKILIVFKRGLVMHKESNLFIHEKIEIYCSLVISLLALVFSVIAFYYDNILSSKESIIIIDASATNYFFDGECLVRNVSLAVYNNSKTDVSITTLILNIENEERRFDSVDNIFLPINLDSKHTEKITIPLQVQIDQNDVEFIRIKYGTNCTIDPYELEMYLEEGKDILNIHNIVITPEMQIALYTAKGTLAGYRCSSRASVAF